MDSKNKEIIEFFKENSSPLTISEINEYLKIDEVTLANLLEELVDEHILYKSKKHKYNLLENFHLYIGKIEVKEKGFGFIKSDSFKEEFFVAPSSINDAMNQDEVIFRKKHINLEKSDEAEVVEVIKRNLKKIVGSIKSINQRLVFIPNDIKMSMKCKVNDFSSATEGDVVVLSIDEIKSKEYIEGHVEKIIGNINDVGIDIKQIAIKYDFSLEFSDEINQEIIDITNNYSLYFEKEKNKREYIDRKIITIDSEDAKDLDDAISVSRLDNGNYFLGVYIADVSFFVNENSLIDEEASSRGTSVYLVDRVIPMLPHKLCNDLCSLNEKTPKLVMACEMEINESGKVVNYEIKEAIISSIHRMTYTNVNKIINNDIKDLEEYNDIFEDIKVMNSLSHILNDMRYKRGSLNFEIPEAKIIVSGEGKVTDIVLRERNDAEKLIEEFMLIANETVASSIYNMDLPFIYRVHDVPNEEKLRRFNRILKNTKYNYRNKNQSINSKTLQQLLDVVNKEDIGLATTLLRMMAKAEYSIDNIGHYGLASKCYTHFTSPIRRYPDLLVHRLLRKYLLNGKVSLEEQSKNIQTIEEVAKHSSMKERDAISCEYEVNDMKMAEYMEDHLNEEFVGTISSVTNFGMFVTLPNTIEGLVRMSFLKDDYYEYNEGKMSLIGRRTHNVYRMGDKVKVKVYNASKEKREIDFIIAGNNNNNMLKYSSNVKYLKGGRNEKTRKPKYRR